MEFYKPNLLRRSTSLSSVILKYFLVTVRLTWLSYRDRHYNIKFYCDGKIFFILNHTVFLQSHLSQPLVSWGQKFRFEIKQ